VVRLYSHGKGIVMSEPFIQSEAGLQAGLVAWARARADGISGAARYII
jgi:hypothetical protein